MVAVRSTHHARPTSRSSEGDEVTVAITNIEQTTDELHGFGLLDYNINIVVDPGETKTVTFKADKKGVFPYYCTNFCSALHQEMQGYLIVKLSSSGEAWRARGQRLARSSGAVASSAVPSTGRSRRRRQRHASSLQTVNRFLDAPLDLGPGSCSCSPSLLPGPDLPLAALEPDDVRAAVPGRAAARHLQLQARGRQRRAGHQGDQRPQPLHRHEGPRRPRTSPSSSGCRSSIGVLGLLFLRAAVLGKIGAPRRRARCSIVYFGALLALVVRLQAVPVRPQPRRRRRR